MAKGHAGGASELNALKNAIVQALNIKAFYEERLNGETLKFKSDSWSEHVHCVIHNDTGKKNFSVSNTSGGFRCFACGKAGSIFDFWCYTNGRDPRTSFQEAIVALAGRAGIDIKNWRDSPAAKTGAAPVDVDASGQRSFVPKLNKAEAADTSIPPIDPKLIEPLCKALEEEHYKYLLYKRGWKDPTIIKYNVGWDKSRKYKDIDQHWKRGKYTIPVKCKAGMFRNIRVYAADAPSDMKMINTKPYGTPPRLWPLDELIAANPTHLIFCEGEWDCGLMNQELEEAGLYPSWMAVTNTAGCNTFEPEWLEYFHGRNVYFIFDCDPPGRTWAQTIASQHFAPLLSSGKIESLKIIALPLDGSKGSNDLTDYFVKLGGKLADLIRIIENTPPMVVGGVNEEDATIEAVDVASFIDCIKDREYIDMRVRVPLTISGQSTKLYHATRSMRVVKCPNMANDNCCSSNSGIQIIPYGDPIFIESCMANRKNLTMALQNVACTMGKNCTVEEVEKVVMEEYWAHQVIKRLTAKDDGTGHLINSQQLVTAPIYLLQPEKRIDVGPHDYMATGWIRSHPGTRAATMFVEHLEPMDEDWRNFEVTPKTIKHLKAIQEYPRVKDLLDEITNGVTQIYQSDDILMAVLLTYLSPLWISFNGTSMRGWINSCIIGDSGTGKSKTYMRISDWLELGDLFSALSGTRTGLLYSLKQKGVEWYVEIGRYVMASGKIIAIDETQKLSAEDMEKMAIAMDEGWLEVSQVASGGYQSQVRAIFILNPPEGKKISDFPYGCQALVGCFLPMFIRRLDIAIFTSGKDDFNFYNQRFVKEEVKIKLTAETMRNLVYWAWTRSINDIHWSEEATQTCLNKAGELSGIYGQSDDIPLISPQDFRNNLARLSTSFAILSGSFTDDYTGVNVKPEHVLKMAKFVDIVYSSQACNLKQYSKNSGKKKTLRDFDNIKETFQKVIDHARAQTDRRWSEGQHFMQMLKMLQSQTYIRKRDLCEQLSVGIEWVTKHVNILMMHNLIEAHRGGYKTTRKFNMFLQKWQLDPEVEQAMDQIEDKIGKLALLSNPHLEGFVGHRDNFEKDPFSDPFHGE